MDHREFARQFQAIYPRLWLIATSIVCDRTEAEDIVQEAAVIAFRKLHTFEVGTSFAAWAARIVRFCAANHTRKRANRRTHATDPAALDQQSRSAQPHASAPTENFDLQSAFDDDMLHALNELSEDARSCLLLRVVEELSYADIANLLGIPPGTAMSHVHRSRRQLRGALQRIDVYRKGGIDE